MCIRDRLLPRGRDRRCPRVPGRDARMRGDPHRDGPVRDDGARMSPLVYGLLFVVAAPLFGGLVAGVDRIVSARMQGRVGPPLLQPFYDVGKLFEKETRQVNPVVEPLLLGHLGFMAAAGALVLGGTDLIFIAFVFALAALCLVLAAAMKPRWP